MDARFQNGKISRVLGCRPLKWSILVAVVQALSPTLPAQEDRECMICHGEKSMSTTRRGRPVALYVDYDRYRTSAHADLGCTSCHDGFVPDEIPHAPKKKRVDCIQCHEGERLQGFAKSVHGTTLKGGRPAASCSDCHTSHAIELISDKETVGRKQFAEQVCAKCHQGIEQKYLQSDHGRALSAGVPGAPSCIDCHGEHAVISPMAEDAPTNRYNEAAMCLSCHLATEKGARTLGPSVGFIASYEPSIHGLAIARGNVAAATCHDCHGSHEMKKGSDPASKVSRANIAATCGECHGRIRDEFEQSIHGKALRGGVLASATCTDCHGEHEILPPSDARSPVSALNVSGQVCSPCHASLKLTRKYGLASDRFQTFEDSYHGLAEKAGSVEVANCASCHGVHDIKPSSDPTSRVHKKNLAATCGSCHPGANENFAKGSVHVIATARQEEILYIVSTAYIILIVVVIGGMSFHNIIDFIRKAKLQLSYRRGIAERRHPGYRLYLRMTLNERIQHGVLLVSFLLLVITGFALRFPDAWWVESVRGLSPLMFDLRGIVHRIAGVLLMGVSLYHVWYVIFTERGRQLVRDLLPLRQDFADAVGVMKYNLGLSRTKPLFGRFNYAEKAEYWALVWGTVVMGLTGFILWFDNTFLALITKLWWDVARTVHYYEAWLATLAIIVWHFYFVIFNPNVYPLNLAFLKGTLTEGEMEEEHPLEIAEFKHAFKEGKVDAKTSSRERPELTEEL